MAKCFVLDVHFVTFQIQKVIVKPARTHTFFSTFVTRHAELTGLRRNARSKSNFLTNSVLHLNCLQHRSNVFQRQVNWNVPCFRISLALYTGLQKRFKTAHSEDVCEHGKLHSGYDAAVLRQDNEQSAKVLSNLSAKTSLTASYREHGSPVQDAVSSMDNGVGLSESQTQAVLPVKVSADLDLADPFLTLRNIPLQERTEFEEDLAKLPPRKPFEPSFNLVPYVSQSEVLQKLVSLGVDLSVVEKVKAAADFVVQADWNNDIQPRLLFLRDVGVLDCQLGQVISKNPLLLNEDIKDMQVRVNYLQSKKFDQDQLARIVTKAPLTLLLPVITIDAKLGFLQKYFHLTGNEVRLVATTLPQIIPWRLQKLKDVRFYIKEFLGFSEKEQKAMLLKAPKVYLSDKHQLEKRFDFLHNTMGLTHRQLVQWPIVLRTRLHIVKQRHRFLLLLGRAQYDASKENYISLQALVSGRDEEFCASVAKVPYEQYENFLKCL